MSFSQKIITASISLAGGNFGSSGNSTTINATGGMTANAGQLQTLLRMSATIIAHAGGPSAGNMELAIYGLPLSQMNQLSIVGAQVMQQNRGNTIQVQAGDAETGLTTVFQGQILWAYVDAANQPQVCFRITGVPGGGGNATTPVKPISLSGSQDVATMMGSLSKQMGLTLENNNVNVKVSNPYYGGSPWTQLVQLARHANIEYFVDRGTLAIVPAGQPRQTGGTPLVSKDTGMVGYPAFRQAQIIVTSLFNPAIQPGGTIQVQSDLTPANGTWRVNSLTYNLECAMPHGRWFQVMECTTASGEQTPT